MANPEVGLADLELAREALLGRQSLRGRGRAAVDRVDARIFTIMICG